MERISALLLTVAPATVTGELPPITEPPVAHMGKPLSIYSKQAFMASSGKLKGAAPSMVPISCFPTAFASMDSHIKESVAWAPLETLVEYREILAWLSGSSITGSISLISKNGQYEA